MSRAAPTHPLPAALAAALFLLALQGLVALGRLPLPLLQACLALSALTALAYARDKWAATHGRWRTAESTLHLLDLLGGWPGALVAQPLLRHKTSKKPFRRLFWLTVALNIAGWAWLLLPPGQRLLAELAARLP